MAIFTNQITEYKNSAWVRGDGTDFTTGDNKLYVYRDADPASSGARHIGLVFDPVTIPSGSTINTAYIEMYANYSAEQDGYFSFFGNDVDDSADFVTEADIYTRARTTASVAVAEENLPIGYFGSTKELKAIVQEIIDRPGWNTGQAMGFLLIGDTGTDKKLRVYGDLGADAPKISIDYTAPTPPSVDFGSGSQRAKRLLTTLSL